jgi:patatin-like phospholipase/acyl hydrolase
MRPFAQLFDLIAGSSTGALIALALAMHDTSGDGRYSASDIVDLYRFRGSEIFPPALRGTIHTAVQAFRYKYSAQGFEHVLNEVFGDETLKGSMTNLLITSFDTEAMQPHCMKRRPDRADLKVEHDYFMRDAARASAAAPTYFPPAHITPVDEPGLRFSLIDGGVFANNPSGLSYVESTEIFPSETETLILSLGTGEPNHGYSYQEIHSWGYMEWVNPMKGFPIGSIMSAGQSEAVIHQLRRLRGVTFFRINIPLGDCAMGMDDAGRKNLECLDRLADQMIALHDDSINQICRMLIERREVPPLR